MSDLFGNWVPYEWQQSVFDAAMGAPWHTYLFLTKNPEGMLNFQKKYYFFNLKEDDERDLFHAIMWWGTTVTGAEDIKRIDTLNELWTKNRFVSFEPLLSDPGDLDLSGIRQVIVGAQTNPTVMPDNFWIAKIQDAVERVGGRMFCKDSLQSIPDCLFTSDLCWPVRK